MNYQSHGFSLKLKFINYSTTRLYKIQRTNLPGFKNLAGLYLTKSGNAITPPPPWAKAQGEN